MGIVDTGADICIILLSEGICRQLGVMSYHPSLGPGREPTEQAAVDSTTAAAQLHTGLVDSVCVPPHQSVIARLEPEDLSGLVLVEPSVSFTGSESDTLCFSETLVDGMSGPTYVVLSNPTGFTRSLDRGTWVGCASQATFKLSKTRLPGCRGNREINCSHCSVSTMRLLP